MVTGIENERLIEEMMRGSTFAKEPGGIVGDQIIHRGDDEVPVPMVATTLESAGYTNIYDTESGEHSITNRNMLPAQLKKKRLDGSYVFTTIKPAAPLMVGNLKCLLHPDNPDRRHYDELGLAVCKKENLTSPFQVRRHMEKRHKMEWATIEYERQEVEKKEERAFQRELLGKVLPDQQVEKAPLYVSGKDKKGK